MPGFEKKNHLTESLHVKRMCLLERIARSFWAFLLFMMVYSNQATCG